MLRYLLRLFRGPDRPPANTRSAVRAEPHEARPAPPVTASHVPPKKAASVPPPWKAAKEFEKANLVLAGQRTINYGFRCDRSLHIVDSRRLKSIGAAARISGNLTIGGPHPTTGPMSHERQRIPLEELPQGLEVAGSLELHSCFRLRQLPPTLSVGGSLIIHDCDALAALPEKLHVAGSLTIVGGRSLMTLPAGLRVQGDFRLAGTRIAEIPADMEIGGSLIIEGRSRITSLPTKVRIGGDIILRHCRIAAISPELRISRDLRLVGLRHLSELPANLAVPRDLDVSGCTSLKALPVGLRVGRHLTTARCTSLAALPEGLDVPGKLDLRGCSSLSKLPGGMKVGKAIGNPQRPAHQRWPWRPRSVMPALRIADCTALQSLPDDLWLGGPIDLAGSGLKDIPEPLSRANILWRGMLTPANVVFHPERLEPMQILNEPNAELRRIMFERVGLERVLDKCGARVIDSDTDPGGRRRLLHIEASRQCYLHCRCPSTGREYLLRVPPDTRSCRQAAAWTAGFENPDDYRPLQET